MERFEVGKVYVTHDWFTGGTLKYQYEGNGKFTVEDFELDGQHTRIEEYYILEDRTNGTEYINLSEYNGHYHRIYAKEM